MQISFYLGLVLGFLEFCNWCVATAGVTSHVDDEYRWAGVEDPRLMVTTSRDPSSRLKIFAKVSGILPFLLQEA